MLGLGVDLETLEWEGMILKMRGTDHSRRYHEVVIKGKGLKIISFSMI